ncbi:hypothetical protein DL96DRAFT_1550847 [Flagelloscypha sp. PMI_526]|nr:hypothetical protein DL96DRAFT_1550847 [Flagelloscypha sp. PMI_526]
MALLDLTKSFLYALDIQDHVAVRRLLHPSKFEHRFFPKSLGGFGKEVRNVDEYIVNLDMLVGKFPEGFKIKILDTVEATDAIVAHICTEGMLYTGTPYTNEYVMIVRFEDDKIVSVKEFMDSAYTMSQAEALLSKAPSGDA